MAQASIRAFDPVQLEILWSRLISIVEEAETTLVRTSYSTTVGEADDHAAALLDARGQILAQSPKGMPAFIAILGRTTRAVLEEIPLEHLYPGDVIVTNDPWKCAGHLHDFNLLRPIFHKGRVIGFAANTAHLSDIGGRVSAESVDLYEEGLQLPTLKLYERGRPNELAMAFIRLNSRTPKQIIGDLNAQLAANLIAERRVLEMIEEYGLDDLESLSDAIQVRTEAAMRAAIEKLPDGTYHGKVFSDGFDEPLTIQAKVTVRGSEIAIDYDGTSAQVNKAINCPFNLTYAESIFPIRASLTPYLPTTDGALRPIHVSAPPGTILNPRRPAAVFSRTVVVHNVHAAIFQALSQMVPQALPASRVHAHSGCIWGFRFRGQWSAADRKPQWAVDDFYMQSYISNGGQGAAGGHDGHSTLSMPDNCANIPIEVFENKLPVMWMRKELRPDSGGPGEARGGLGQTMELRVLGKGPVWFTTGSGDKIVNPPPGILGGEPGGRAAVLLNGETTFARRWVPVEDGDVVTMHNPGGGGAGDPRRRAPERVATDVRAGYVSAEAARGAYRVAVRNDGTVDEARTRALREES
ncbi:MAG: hydantoinase B/oxoprolinase family protein [Armatimonadetes bacterium]|nr:hydantoinase B/oxoprolinase family protein [Armatimonadota bacterium]